MTSMTTCRRCDASVHLERLLLVCGEAIEELGGLAADSLCRVRQLRRRLLLRLDTAFECGELVLGWRRRSGGGNLLADGLRAARELGA